MIKKYSIVMALFFLANIYLPLLSNAQTPERISYQAVIRNSSNQLVINKQVGMKISIQKYVLGLPPTYQNVYIETQKPTTNDNGLVSVQIGGGTIVGGTFTSINWGDGTYYIKTEVDPAGGTNYTITGQSQILSVPYALHAQTVETLQTDATIDGEGNTAQPLKIAQQSATKGQTLQWDGTAWKPGVDVSIGDIKIVKFGKYYFRTGYSVPLLISYQDLGVPEREMGRFVIINLEVGWASATPNHAEQYRSLKEGIHYEFCPWINSISHTFTGIKVYFPDKTEYWDKDGRIWYMLLE